jgi:hypothetical protein
VALVSLIFVFQFVQGTGIWKSDDVTDPVMTARMERAQQITAAYAKLAPWLTDCKAKSKSNPATCYFGTPNKDGLTPISGLVGQGVAAVSAGKAYKPTVEFATAMKTFARTNVRRMPKTGTDRKAWTYLMNADKAGPMCLSSAKGNEGEMLFQMGRCYNIALFTGYSRTDAPYAPHNYVPEKITLILAAAAILLGYLIYRGRKKPAKVEDRPKDYDTTIMEAVR